MSINPGGTDIICFTQYLKNVRYDITQPSVYTFILLLTSIKI